MLYLLGMAYPAGIKVAKWARAEQRKRTREANRGQTRNTFGFLFGLAVLVFIYSDHSAFQNYLYTRVGPLLVSLNNSSEFKLAALRHEREVNDIAH
jgi:hypothetical protein